MPLTLGQGVALVADQSLQNRVALGFYFVAREVLTETTGAAREQRVAFARSIILQDYTAFLQYTALIVTDESIVAAAPASAAAISDGQLVGAVRAIWNRLAGVAA
jgi:hypothetical protein